MKKYIFIILFSTAISLGILYFFGYVLEDNIRNFYRDKICNCDTLRAKEFKDSLGVPYINYYSITGQDIGIKSNPSLIAMEANKYYESIDTVHFLNCINWFDDNIVEKDSLIFIYHYYDWYYNMKSPWLSAMAQSLMLKSYTQAFLLTNDSTYLKKTYKILNTFFLDVDSGGVTHLLNDSSYWYEEYSDTNGEKPMILNGMMYSLEGFIYYSNTIKSEKVNILINNGLNSLVLYLPEYNIDNYSYYDIKKNLATEYYHSVHVDLLKKLFEYSQNITIEYYYIKWNKHKPTNYFKSTYKDINKSKVLTITLVFSICYLIVLFLNVFISQINKSINKKNID